MPGEKWSDLRGQSETERSGTVTSITSTRWRVLRELITRALAGTWRSRTSATDGGGSATTTEQLGNPRTSGNLSLTKMAINSSGRVLAAIRSSCVQATGSDLSSQKFLPKEGRELGGQF